MFRAHFRAGPVEFFELTPLMRCVYLAALAQLAEHLTCNHEVSGSNPGNGSAIKGYYKIFDVCCSGEFPEWSNGADCKSVGSAFEGSNPPLPIWP